MSFRGTIVPQNSLLVNTSKKNGTKKGEMYPMKESTKFVMNNIATSLLKLMKSKSLNEISICEIVKTAEVSRNSFYRHFQDKDDIIRYYISSETDYWLNQTTTNLLNVENISQYIIFLLEHIYLYHEFIDLLIRDNKMYLLEQEFDKRYKERLNEIVDPFRISFIMGGFYKLFCYWAETGYQKTPQEIAEYIK